MNKSLVIEISTDATVQAMHMDGFPLSFLGRMEVERASELKFNPDTQLWDIHVSDGHGGFNAPLEDARGFVTYEAARDIEVAWFNEARLNGHHPESDGGQFALKRILFNRAEMERRNQWNSGDLIAAMMRDGAGS